MNLPESFLAGGLNSSCAGVVHVKTLVAVGLLTLLLSGLESLWWVANLFAELRFHLAVALLALAALAVMRNLRWCATGALIGAVAALAYVFPGLIERSGPAPSTEEMPALKVFSHNLSNESTEASATVEAIRRENPDLVFLFEVTKAHERDLAGLEDVYPHQIVEAREDEFGIACLSRRPIESQDVVDYSGYEIPSIVVRLPWEGTVVTVVGTHPPPPVSAALYRVRGWHLADLAEELAGLDGPYVVAGDLNMAPWTLAFFRFTQGAELKRLGNRPFAPTWSPFRLPVVGLPLDHHLVSKDGYGVKLVRGHYRGSDHRWLLSELVFPLPRLATSAGSGESRIPGSAPKPRPE